MNFSAYFASFLLFSILVSSAYALMPVSESCVSVHVPDGIDEKISNDFNAETPNYLFAYNAGRTSMVSLSAKSGSRITDNVIASGSKSMACTIMIGNEAYTTANDLSEKHVWFRKSGKYLWEISITDIEFINSRGKKLPITADQWFWFWNDKIYTSMVIHPKEDMSSIKSIYIEFSYKNDMFAKLKDSSGDRNIESLSSISKVDGDYAIFSDPVNQTVLTQSSIGADIDGWQIVKNAKTASIDSVLYLYDASAHNGKTTELKKDEEKRIPVSFHILNASSVKKAVDEVMCDINPLAPDSISVIGATFPETKFHKFDNERGCYTLEIHQKPNSIWWNDDKNFILETNFKIKNDKRNRSIRLRTFETPYTYNVTGTASVLCDKDKFPIGIPVQISKKWDGNIHPNYTETYAIFNMRKNENAELWHRTAYHNWGQNVFVGIPSLDLIDYNGLYGIWLESHIGASETVCYSHDDTRGGLIQDFRAQQGTKGQMNTKNDSCWYDNSGGANLFRLLRPNAEDAYLKRTVNGIDWVSPGPISAYLKWTEKTLKNIPHIETKATSYLIPSKKNSRVFYKYRTDFKESFDVSDPLTELCLFVMNDRRYYSVMVPSALWHSQPDGSIKKTAVEYNKDGWIIKGEKFGGKDPWLAAGNSITHPVQPDSYPSGSNHAGIVIHQVKGSIGGAKINKDNLAYSTLQNSAIGKCEISVVPDISIGRVNAGDYVELLVEYFTWDPADGATSPIEAEALYNIPEVKCITGRSRSEFPIEISAINNIADFEISGGVGFNVIKIGGFKNHRPIFETYRNGKYEKINFSFHRNDGWQTDYDIKSKRYSFTIAIPVDSSDPLKPARYKISSY